MTEPGAVERLRYESGHAARQLRAFGDTVLADRLDAANDALAPLCSTCGGTAVGADGDVYPDGSTAPCPDPSCVNGRDYSLVRLADAAPKLVEAAEQAFRYLDAMWPNETFVTGGGMAAREALRAALSAARGEDA